MRQRHISSWSAVVAAGFLTATPATIRSPHQHADQRHVDAFTSLDDSDDAEIVDDVIKAVKASRAGCRR